MESQWKELNETLDERARNGKERSEQLLAYEQLRDRCMQWLTTTENTMDNFRPVGLEQEIVRKQTEDLKVGVAITFCCKMSYTSFDSFWIIEITYLLFSFLSLLGHLFLLLCS